MKMKSNVNLLILSSIVLVVAVSSFLYYLYVYAPKTITAKHFIDAFGKDVPFGKPIIATDNSLFKVSGQMSGIGSDSKGNFISVLLQSSDNQVISQKIRIGGDIDGVNNSIYKQGTYDIDPIGDIRYEELSVSDLEKLLGNYKGPVSFLVFLKKDMLAASPKFSSDFLDEVIPCNNIFLDNLVKGSPRTDCRPFTLQLSIVNE